MDINDKKKRGTAPGILPNVTVSAPQEIWDILKEPWYTIQNPAVTGYKIGEKFSGNYQDFANIVDKIKNYPFGMSGEITPNIQNNQNVIPSKPSPEATAVSKVVAKNAGSLPVNNPQHNDMTNFIDRQSANASQSSMANVQQGVQFPQPSFSTGIGMQGVEQRANPYDNIFLKSLEDYRNLASSIRPSESGYLGDTYNENLSTIQEKKAIENIIKTIAPMTSFGSSGIAADKSPVDKTTDMMKAIATMQTAQAHTDKIGLEKSIFEEGKPLEMAKTMQTLGTYGYDQEGKPKVSTALAEIRSVDMFGRYPASIRDKSPEEKAIWYKDKMFAFEGEMLEHAGYKNTGEKDKSGRLVYKNDKGDTKYLSKE